MEVFVSSSRLSDISLVEVRSDVVKDEDKEVLLEGGAQQPASPKPRGLTASSPIFRFVIHVVLAFACLNCGFVFLSLLKLILSGYLAYSRFLLMDECFLIENRLTLRAM